MTYSFVTRPLLIEINRSDNTYWCLSDLFSRKRNVRRMGNDPFIRDTTLVDWYVLVLKWFVLKKKICVVCFSYETNMWDEWKMTHSFVCETNGKWPIHSDPCRLTYSYKKRWCVGQTEMGDIRYSCLRDLLLRGKKMWDQWKINPFIRDTTHVDWLIHTRKHNVWGERKRETLRIIDV